MRFYFHPQFIFRTPVCPFPRNIISEKKIREIASTKKFQEAIYIATPVLYYEMKMWLKGELKEEKKVRKLIFSLHKYLNQMQSRCTPYGLFAGCGVGSWGNKSRIVLSDQLSASARFPASYSFRAPVIWASVKRVFFMATVLVKVKHFCLFLNCRSFGDTYTDCQGPPHQ